MGLRELLILVLILAIVGVMVRGLYVALRARRGQLRMALDKNVPRYDPDEISLSELPNGGARMVERSFAHVVRQNSEFSSRDKIGKGKSDQAIPVLMDSVGDDDDEEELSPVRASSVASARHAARHRRSTLGGKTVITPKPTHRPIDVMPARTAAIPASAAAAPTFDGAESSQSYVDPLDSHVFKDELEDDAPYETDAYEDDAYDDEIVSHNEPEEWPDTDLDETLDGTLDGDLDDNLVAPVDDGLDDTLDAIEDLPDEIAAAVTNQPFVAVPFAAEPFARNVHDDEDDYIDDEDYDDDIEQEYDEEEYEDELEDDELEDDDRDDDRSVNEVEDDFDAEDDELEAEEFVSIYADQRGETRAAIRDNDSYDDYDDEDDELDDYRDEDEGAKSGPRRWLQWAGDKISGMTSAAVSRGEREREQDAIDRQRRKERAEPIIGGNSFDDSMMEESIAAPAPASRSRPEPLHKSRQSELNLGDPLDDDAYEDEISAVPEPSSPMRAERDSQPSRQHDSPRTKVADAPVREAKVEAKSEPKVDYSEVMVLNVVAKPDREFIGVDLLPVLLTTGLRFGDMSIFHRHLDNDKRGPVLFSVANIVNPGTFDLNQINDFATRGLCFFMTLPNVANSMQAFDLMLDVAQQVRIALDGDLKDDNRSVMTAQTIEHYRQRVRDFDLRQMRQQK